MKGMDAGAGLEPATISSFRAMRLYQIRLPGNASPPGRFRSGDLLIFSQALLPAELPGDIKRRGRDLNPRRRLNRSFLAGKCHKPLGHLSTVGRAGFEPARS